MLDLNVLYSVLLTDIHDISARVGRSLQDSPISNGGVPRPDDCTTAEAAALALAKSFGKKCTDIVDVNAVDRCLLSFVEANGSCQDWRLEAPIAAPLRVEAGRLSANPVYGGFESVWNRQMLERVRMCLRDTFCRPTPTSLLREYPDFEGESPFAWENIFLCGDVGPGVALMASGTSWYDKFYQSTLTYTHPVLMEAYLESLPVGSVRAFAESQRNAAFGTLAVQGGKFGSVPKSFETDRSIETQPSLNMYAQKGIAVIMAAFLKQKYGFDLRTQPALNAELARRGSVSGAYATIDLKDASNRIPKRFIQWALEGTPLLGVMDACRTEQILMPWGEWLENHLYSGMGNGYTFVLQTAVFLAVLEAVFLYRDANMFSVPIPTVPGSTCSRAWSILSTEIQYDSVRSGLKPPMFRSFMESGSLLPIWQRALEKHDLPSWAVFGDDIICLTEFYQDVVKVLGLINAKVNLEKSFSFGAFRESCGSDWYNGSLIRGVYVKSLKTPQDRMVVLNRLIEWSAITGLKLPRTCQALWKSLKGSIVTVPLHESHDAGLRVTLSYHRALPKSRSVLGIERDIQSRVNTYYSYVPIIRKRTFSGAEHQIYGAGILLSMIKGEVRSEFDTGRRTDGQESKRKGIPVYSLTERTDQVAYESKWCWSACWDTPLNPYLTAAFMDAALSRNLGALLR